MEKSGRRQTIKKRYENLVKQRKFDNSTENKPAMRSGCMYASSKGVILTVSPSWQAEVQRS
jgi:hypothetical protein